MCQRLFTLHHAHELFAVMATTVHLYGHIAIMARQCVVAQFMDHVPNQ